MELFPFELINQHLTLELETEIVDSLRCFCPLGAPELSPFESDGASSSRVTFPSDVPEDLASGYVFSRV
jgi:hypothetical protein